MHNLIHINGQNHDAFGIMYKMRGLNNWSLSKKILFLFHVP